MNAVLTHYELLGVGPSSDQETLRKAYRRLARKHHPDVNPDPKAHENMARINEAFETLIDPAKRNEYDAILAGGGHYDSAERTRQNQKPVIVKLLHRLKGHKTPVYTVAFSPEDGRVVSTGFDNEIIWWDEDTAAPRKMVKIDFGTISVMRAFSLGRIVAAGSAENQVNVYRMDGGRVETSRTHHDEWVGCLAISPDGSRIATGSMHATTTITNTQDGRTIYRKLNHETAVTALAWSLDGRVFASGSADMTVKICSAQTGEVIREIRQVRSTITALAFSNDGVYIAVAAVDLSIRIFRLTDGELVKMMYGHTRPIESLSFHPNNWLFASGSRDGTIGLWNAAEGIGNVRIEASNRPISSVIFSPDGTRLAACGQDKLVRLWEVAVKES